MPRGKREAGASPSATDAAVLTFAQVIEFAEQRSLSLTERAARLGLVSSTAAVRTCGRTAVDALRDLAGVERRLNAVQVHEDALATLGRDGSATSPTPARTQPIHRISSTQVQLRLVRARAKGEAALEAEKQAIHRESGLGMPRISALLARTNGKNRLQWARRFLLTVSGDERKQLADELSGYGYGPVAQLLRGLGR